ncbi:hypothetical protein BVY01_00855, partial [bacterium I07]
RGGGDWYNDPSALPNLARFIKRHSAITISDEEARISLTDETLFSHPILFLTGHGQIDFNSEEVRQLRLYLLNGGFLYADDDYGMDSHFRREMKKVFPDRSWVELPFSHGIYNCHFPFRNGPPKIHEHDNKAARGYGLFDNGRLIVYYTVESNISDGWADPETHNDPQEQRLKALQMGANIIIWALMN